MYVENVYERFKRYIDEPDQTFVSDAIAQDFLALGYDEFRAIVESIDPYFYATGADLTLSGQQEYDLAMGSVAILGPNVNRPRMSRLLEVLSVNGNGVYPWTQVSSSRAVRRGERTVQLAGTFLSFSEVVTGTIRLIYSPVSSVDWSKTTAGDNEFIDDLTQFHDVIALLAYEQYAVQDGARNDGIDKLLFRRRAALEDYLQKRAVESTQFVHRIEDGTEGWY